MGGDTNGLLCTIGDVVAETTDDETDVGTGTIPCPDADAGGEFTNAL